MDLKTWLRERRTALLFVGIVVPALGVLTFWDVIGSDWPLWLACYVVGLPAGVAVVWGRQRLSDTFTRLTRSQRMLICSLAVAALWCLLVLVEHDRSAATWMTAAVALLWGAYVLFSRGIDKVWSRLLRR